MTYDPFHLDPFSVLADDDGNPLVSAAESTSPTYRCRHRELEGIWTVQISGDEFPQEKMATFNGLRHENIASVLIGELDGGGGTYHAVEFCAGGSLQQLLKTQGPLAWPIVRWIAFQIADALEIVHAAGLVHGKIHAANTFLAEPWPSHQIKLGPLDVAAPDDPRSDLFSTGVTLLELLTGASPPESHDPEQIADPEARQILAGLLADPPDGRISSASHLLEQLAEGLLNSLPLETEISDESPSESQPEKRAVMDGPPPLAEERSGHSAPPAPSKIKPSPARGKSGWPKIAASAAAAFVLAGISIYFLSPKKSPPPDTKPDQQKENTAKEIAAREQQAKEAAAKELAAKELAAREEEARILAANDLAKKEQAAKELAAQEQIARENAAREQATRDEAAKQQALRDAELAISQSEKILADPGSSLEMKAKFFAQILPLAKEGNVKAIELCGASYWQGNGVAKDQIEASRWFEKGAQSGNPRSMLGLGNCFEQGIGFPQDLKKAADWWQQAAAGGEPLAMSRLGEYYNSDPAEKDIQQAMAWWQKAADRGVPEAMTNLGIVLSAGTAGEKNPAKAIELWQRAATLGEPRAMAELGYQIFNGDVPGKDKTDAFLLFQKAVESNDPRAMTGLGVCYLTGSGTPTDRAAAEKWLRRAADLGEPTAAQYLKKLEAPAR